MKLPIQYALTYPERRSGVAERLNWAQTMTLEFHPPDLDRFDAIRLGLEVAEQGGTAGAVLNGANEAAVAALLDGHLAFDEVVPACRSVVEHHDFDPHPSLEHVLRLDRWAREEVQRWACT
jgi:1-deoxy-D-xylulose-5-phosphate reductoisomerase